MKEIWILLFAAHVYGDFLLQSDRVAADKRSLPNLMLHVCIHGMVAYLILQQWQWWPLIPAVALMHALVDFVKARFQATSRAFVVDQVVHVLTLGALAWLLGGLLPQPETLRTVVFHREIVLGAGFVAAVFGVGFFIRAVSDEMCDQNPELRHELSKGLRHGGSMIGKLERALIFVFVMIGQPSGIGFLIAAKSILRFEESKKQPLAEYVLIGTLWSVGLALSLAFLTLRAIR